LNALKLRSLDRLIDVGPAHGDPLIYPDTIANLGFTVNHYTVPAMFEEKISPDGH
jgi:hypothetical protein